MAKLISPFHEAEQEIQSKLGVRRQMEQFGQQVIRTYMPEQHREFYENQRYLFVGYADDAGWPWASIVYGEHKFISSPLETSLKIRPNNIPGDPLYGALKPGLRLGVLGLELASRRRNRLSTTVAAIDKQTNQFELEIDQAFGNCPQYIHTRSISEQYKQRQPTHRPESFTEFDANTHQFISRADTFMVSSYVGSRTSEKKVEGVDVSHRGGRPGFIKLASATSLIIPDYTGNFHFNTLGNFLQNPRAGLLFMDFDTGDLLQLTGTVEILWEHDHKTYFDGAERFWQFNLAHGHWLRAALPFSWQLEQVSPNNQLTGTWAEAEARKHTADAEQTFLEYRVEQIVEEAMNIRSFYLSPTKGKVPPFKPGQYITARTEINGRSEIRNYTVSSSPGDAVLRITVKHALATKREFPDGHVSTHLHQQIRTGANIELRQPSGAFFLDDSDKGPVVLLAAGIGITPMISMVRHLFNHMDVKKTKRQVYLLLAARNHAQRAFAVELKLMEATAEGSLHIHWALSQPESHLEQSGDFQSRGRINSTLIQAALPAAVLSRPDSAYYLCGPGEFMQTRYYDLIDLGVSDKRIFAENFGPSSIKRTAAIDQPNTTTATTRISFYDLANQLVTEQLWQPGDGTLLEFAEAHGLSPSYGCRSGNCGSCTATCLNGQVHYDKQPGSPLDQDDICLCLAQPGKLRTEKDDVLMTLELRLP